MSKDERKSIHFCVNGISYEVKNEYPPSTTLLEFLRTTGISTGTKGCCLEGGCGVCVVTAKYDDPLTEKPKTYSVTSCCLPLYSCDSLDITTIEGLGNTHDGLHPIQDRLAKFDGVQCGFCSPGQVMCMYGLLQNNARPKMKEVEDAFDTTICRCTGYRSILDAMKSFAIDAPTSLCGGTIDIEELNGKVCCLNRHSCFTLLDFDEKPLKIVRDGWVWFKPTTLPQLVTLLREHATDKYRLVFGNTGFGFFKELSLRNYQTIIDIRGVKELYIVDLDDGIHITLGANLTLTNLKDLLESIDDPGVFYGKEFADHIQYVSSTGVRNLGSWAGNLMLKHLHQNFVSNIFTILETVGTTLNIVDALGRNKNYSLPDFLSTNMNGKVIVSMQLPKYKSKNIVIRTFRTSPRLQNSTSYVATGFNFQIDAKNDYFIENRPTIVVQGISTALIHATKTEAYLTNKKLADPVVLQEAIQILSGELVADPSTPTIASAHYRISLAIGHFYKFVLGVCKDRADSRYVSGGLDLERPVMTATHEYGTQNESTFPVSKPIMKITAPDLATGEVKYVEDQPVIQGQLFGAPVLSTQGNAEIDSIDSSHALAIPGVVAVVLASDIPGLNNWRPSVYAGVVSEVLSSGPVLYAGQPVAIIVAECESIAREAAQKVQITYKNIKPVIVDVFDAIEQKSFLMKFGPITKGDAQAALESAPHRVKGNTRSREQYHFHMENQVSICTPTDLGGMYVFTTTQWTDAIQECVAKVLGIPEASVTAETQRLGGGFGGKIIYNIPVATMTAVAAYKVKKPVKMALDLQTNMQFQGNREGYYYEYEIGFDNDGKIMAIVATAYGDCGPMLAGEDTEELTYNYVDSAYFCPNWSWTVQLCKTNRPVCTPMRAPGSATSIFAMECMMDHIATFLKKDQLEVRKINLFKNGQTTLAGFVLENVLARQVIQELETDINYIERKQLVEDFNKVNRWRKRGIHVMPVRYSFNFTTYKHNTSVIIYHGDASVIVAHGGIDIGQGINTKAIQCCAFKLGIPIDKIRVAKSSSVINANSFSTGGSTTSELICKAVLTCCEVLNRRLEPTKKSLKNPTWEEVITKAYSDGVNLHAQYWPETPLDRYSSYSACCAEVELDVLTGQYSIIQVDYVYDNGISLNPELDLGQLEGGFVMGCGLFLLEHMELDPQTSKALTDGTATYKPPLGKDLPFRLNAKFLKNVFNPTGVLGSKAVAEAPVSQGPTPMMALKRAVEAARAEIGLEGWFPFYAPATVEKIQLACLNDVSKYTLGN